MEIGRGGRVGMWRYERENIVRQETGNISKFRNICFAFGRAHFDIFDIFDKKVSMYNIILISS